MPLAPDVKRLARLPASAAALFLVVTGSVASGTDRRAPEFPSQEASRWVGAPVRLQDLRGRVVLLDVWTFG